MRKTFVLFSVLAVLSVSTVASADEYVHGYTKKDGTYVEPYYRSSPDSTRDNNYSTRGNVNPYTGQTGTKCGDECNGGSSSYANSYSSPNSSYSDPYARQRSDADQSDPYGDPH